MGIRISIRSESSRKGVYRRDTLTRLTNRVCAGEGLEGDAELSILFCDDEAIQALNHRYRGMNKPTDVLSFQQDFDGPVHILGDIVISLETVERVRDGDAAAMRAEVRMLYCHGLLHLLGYDHENAKDCREMAAKQAAYLRLPLEVAWPAGAGTQ
jgi:probable rRNA maturation factor